MDHVQMMHVDIDTEHDIPGGVAENIFPDDFPADATDHSNDQNFGLHDIYLFETNFDNDPGYLSSCSDILADFDGFPADDYFGNIADQPLLETIRSPPTIQRNYNSSEASPEQHNMQEATEANLAFEDDFDYLDWIESLPDDLGSFVPSSPFVIVPSPNIDHVQMMHGNNETEHDIPAGDEDNILPSLDAVRADASDHSNDQNFGVKDVEGLEEATETNLALQYGFEYFNFSKSRPDELGTRIHEVLPVLQRERRPGLKLAAKNVDILSAIGDALLAPPRVSHLGRPQQHDHLVKRAILFLFSHEGRLELKAACDLVNTIEGQTPELGCKTIRNRIG